MNDQIERDAEATVAKLLALPAEEWDALADAAPRDIAMAQIFGHVRDFADKYELRPSQVMAIFNAGKVAAGVLWPNDKARWLL